MRPWKIAWTDTALRDLQGVDSSVARQIVRRVERAASNPGHYFERLVGSDDRKLRIGEFRLLASLSPKEQLIIVEHLDHRRRVYK